MSTPKPQDAWGLTDGFGYGDLSKMIGATLFRVERFPEQLFLTTSAGVFSLVHHRDCCEEAQLEYTGPEGWLDPFPTIRLAEARTVEMEQVESGTATFYAIRTDGPDIDCHWTVESNGYYSEEIDVERRALSVGDLLEMPEEVRIRYDRWTDAERVSPLTAPAVADGMEN